eukprot:5468007-Pyramimonas_sp.AAC.1
MSTLRRHDCDSGWRECSEACQPLERRRSDRCDGAVADLPASAMNLHFAAATAFVWRPAPSRGTRSERLNWPRPLLDWFAVPG